MANLVISAKCNLHCDYCFARDFLQHSVSSRRTTFIRDEAYQARLDFLAVSSIKEVRMIGGEPGLHPDFPRLLQEAEKRFQNIIVFSNGIFGETALEALEALPSTRLTVMVNSSAQLTTARQKNLRGRALKRLGPRVHLGYTIQQVDFNCDNLIPMILENGCRKSIRLGLAMPVLAGKTAFLSPRQYPLVGESIVNFSRLAARDGIRVEFDCGFVRCMFSPEALQEMKELGVYAEYRCSPVLDIDLQEEVSFCFPMAGRFKRPFDPKIPAANIRQAFTEAVKSFRQAGVFKECSSCPFKLNNTCTGGCMAATLLRFKEASFQSLPMLD
jgi:radical SAM protein with 4Fe4S-binding SPASM domain